MMQPIRQRGAMVVALLLILGLAACGKKKMPAAPSSAPPREEPASTLADDPAGHPVRVTEEEIAPPVLSLEAQADSHFVQGNYGAASSHYQQLIGDSDVALFRYLLCLTLTGRADSIGDYDELLDKLLSTGDPEHAAMARALIDYRKEARNLRSEQRRTAQKLSEAEAQLERLKELDLKRSRPPES